MLLITFQLLGCSEDSVNHAETDIQESQTSEQKTEFVEEYSDLYFMHGIQISKRFCYLGHPDVCEDGEVIDSDTLKTSFLIMVTYESDKPDSVLFDGLEGANTKPREMVSEGFNGLAATAPDFLCRPSRDCGYAKLTGAELEIEVYTSSGHYSGTGTLDNDRLTIQAEYLYRGAGADYILEGHKIVEEK
jgi:hypothetical protein